MNVAVTTVNFIKRHRVWLGILLVAILAVILLGNSGSNQEQITNEVLPLVTVSSAAKLAGDQTISVLGTVRAFSEASIASETSGRITTVNATLGQTVPAGFVVGTIENASERAAVLQAEGSYEATLAASAQSDVGVTEAQNALTDSLLNGITTARTAYTSSNLIVLGSIDNFFEQPKTPLPTLSIAGRGNTQVLNQERVAYQSLLPAWKTRVDSLTSASDIITELGASKNDVERTIRFLDTFLTVFASDNDSRYVAAEQEFLGLRNNLLAVAQSIDSSTNTIRQNEEIVNRSQISATGSVNSAADAQVKQALGSLRAAQASLAKTILRTPISGTVNSLNVRVGDFVSAQTVVARVANNNALEIITFVGDAELSALSIGSEVTIEDQFTGTVTEIAPAVDPATRKTEVRIAIETEEIQNGDTVTITKTIASQANDTQRILVPLSAVKFEIENGFVFVVDNNRLATRAVTLGTIRGGSVEIIEGLSLTDEFVLDARGLLADTEVEVRTQ